MIKIVMKETNWIMPMTKIVNLMITRVKCQLANRVKAQVMESVEHLELMEEREKLQLQLL